MPAGVCQRNARRLNGFRHNVIIVESLRRFLIKISIAPPSLWCDAKSDL
ncbi:hypothetical protein HMPREF0201_02463 [Cedecea davisae DSM 4568]|uniref:Uncharacterized protein n=1 Tax=Cedecea davisae DSM 4568 TaxID=566551 RepID=S3IUR3_9ENTR|nr:hypothetical protein HMPREF0201_02463 [Cedecea davisae DSM 4568]